MNSGRTDTQGRKALGRLPSIMVAPNGARRGKDDHPALPTTIPETVNAVVGAHLEGAGGAHLHVRDSSDRHILDVGLYRELLSELATVAPSVVAQITTESVGLYSSGQQRELVQDLKPSFVSVAMREICGGEKEDVIRAFFHWAHEAEVSVQHILYTPQEVRKFARLVERNIIPSQELEALFVLGRYSTDQQSSPQDMDSFLAQMKLSGLNMEWAVCAFGSRETDCLVKAMGLGGKARIGFENNYLNRDGTVALDNAARVKELVSAIRDHT